MKAALLIPFKGSGLKSRLTPALDEQKRQELAELMLMDVLDAVSRAGLMSSCFVITSSKSVAARVDRAGARAIMENTDRGVNSAVKTGLRATDATDVMVIPSDLPLLRGSEIRDALGLKASGMDVVIAPSMDFDGTNLLAFSRNRPLDLSFDQDSFWNHLEDASRRGYRVVVYSEKGVRFDVDTVVHLRQLSRSRSGRNAVAFAREVVSP